VEEDSPYNKADNKEWGTGKLHVDLVMSLLSKYLNDAPLTASTLDALLSKQAGILDELSN
jgi:hypothetical protein